MSEEKPLRLVFSPALTDAMLQTVIKAMDTELQSYPGYSGIGASQIQGNKVHIDLKPIIFQDTRDKVAAIIGEVKSHYPAATVEEVFILRALRTLIANSLGIPEDKVF